MFCNRILLLKNDNLMKIGIIREDKVPVDRRVPFTPEQCQEIIMQFPNTEIIVQPSMVRCFKDVEYASAGFAVREDLSDCDVLFGVKEVPKENLLPHKTYFFFSHTIKKQPYNQTLLQTILRKNIQLVDYEVLTDTTGTRIVAFGRYAGLVGAYNGLLAFGKRTKAFNLKPAHACFDLNEMLGELAEIELPPIKLIITGGGRVASGAMEILDYLKIPQVTVSEFLTQEFDKAVYIQLNPEEYNQPKDGGEFDLLEFYKNPENFTGNFTRFLPVCDILIASAYWSPQAPVLFTAEDMKQDCKLQVIADITCDIEGSIPSTKRPSTIDDPLYDYNPQTEALEPALNNAQNVTVMAVDNLPCELPRNASEDFGNDLIKNVLPSLIGEDADKIIERASITKKGELTPYFTYLEDYVF